MLLGQCIRESDKNYFVKVYRCHFDIEYRAHLTKMGLVLIKFGLVLMKMGLVLTTMRAGLVFMIAMMMMEEAHYLSATVRQLRNSRRGPDNHKSLNKMCKKSEEFVIFFIALLLQ